MILEAKDKTKKLIKMKIKNENIFKIQNTKYP